MAAARITTNKRAPVYGIRNYAAKLLTASNETLDIWRQAIMKLHKSGGFLQAVVAIFGI